MNSGIYLHGVVFLVSNMRIDAVTELLRANDYSFQTQTSVAFYSEVCVVLESLNEAKTAQNLLNKL